MRSGIEKSEIWDYDTSMASIESLRKSPFYPATYASSCDSPAVNTIPSLVDVVRRLQGLARDFIWDADIAVVGTVHLNTSRSAHLTNSSFIDSVKEVQERRNSVAAANAARAEEAQDHTDAAGRLRVLGPILRVLRKRLRDTRHSRRSFAAQSAATHTLMDIV